MNEAKDLSTRLLTERKESIPGSTLAVIREGKRPIVVEIESLVSKCYTPYPSRNCENFKRDTLNMLVSVANKKAFIRFDDQDVLLKPTGDIRINESSSNLAALMSIVSSAKNKALPLSTAFIGEVGLTGEVKKVNYLEARVKEVDRLGFKTVVIPNQNLKLNEEELNIKVVRVNDINECIKYFEL
jgi:DNA repair protein RadA/Sms